MDCYTVVFEHRAELSILHSNVTVNHGKYTLLSMMFKYDCATVHLLWVFSPISLKLLLLQKKRKIERRKKDMAKPTLRCR